MTASARDGDDRSDDLEDEHESEPTKVDDAATRRFGRFELCFELASGGMATVYLARMSGPGGFGKLVALKRVHPHLAKQKKFVDMFLDEARIASRVTHPNVCSVVDFGEAKGSYYLAMDYLVGESLSGVLRFSKKADDEVKKRLPFIAARIVSDAAEGLHAAHEVRGDDGKLLDIVHRDVSPQNIFVTYEGGVSIVDFGIATASDRSAFTAAGQIKGKYAYVAPEQVRAEKVDRRADIWSLGVVLWELLTRKRLFRRANEAETLIAVTSAEIPAPSSVCPEAPPELDAVVLKALSRDREDRFATAREMSREILRALAKTGEMVSMGDVAELMAHAFPGGEERKRQLVSIATAPGRIPKVHTPEADSLTGQEPSSSAVRSVPPKRDGGPNVLPWAIVGVLLVALLGVSLVLATGGDDEEVASVDGAPGSTGPGAERPAGGGTEGPASSTMAPEVATDRPATTMAPSIATTQPATTMAATTASTTPTTTARERERERERETREPRTGTMSTTRMSTSGTTMRTEPETSSTPATNATGTVNVVTPGGWAEVWWRGRRVGQTPGRVTIAAGRQRLELRPFGRTPARPVEVTVPADGTTRVSVDLR